MYLFAIFFALSGFCSLVYQVAWLRIAMADFGVTSTMIAIVLSVFMAGLSFGSWSGGQVAARFSFKRPGPQLRLYGVMEGVIGLSGLVSAPLLGYGQILLAKSTGTEWGSGSYYLASGAIVFIVLFPFCVCMGATFPIAMAAVKRADPEKSATSFSYLYLANLLGAVLGCTATAFVLIELLGFRGSMLIAVALNLAIALAAFVLGGRPRLTVKASDHASTESGDLAAAPPGGKTPYAVLLLTGIVSMALEVVWTRQFTPFLGPVVYTFATILAIFLAATFAGSRYYRQKCGSPLLLDGTVLLGVLTAVAGLAAILPLLTADYRLPLPAGIVGGALRAAVGIAPFGFIVGFITPWVVDRLSSGDPKRAGVAYAVNTTGCIIGPLMAGFLLLPAVGERWSTFLLAIPFFLLSPLLSMGQSGQGGGKYVSAALLKWTLFLTVSISGLLVLLTKDFEKRYPDAVVLRDHTATVVAAGDGMNKQLLVNGYGMTVLTPITKMMVHLPLALHASPPANGLVLCFGMGTSFRSMLSWGIPATVVELVPSIPRLFSFFHVDAESLLADPNARVVVDDARRYLYRTAERFDVIVLDPPPPLEAAASSLLYSREFYRSVAGRLADGGIFHQWTDTSDPYLRASIVRSLTAVFPFVRAFNSLEGWGVHLLASNRPFPDKTPYEMAAALGSRAAADMVEWGPFANPPDQFKAVLSGELTVAQLIQGAPDARAIEDDRPINEYYLLRKLFR
jgi:spermidine synthase